MKTAASANGGSTDLTNPLLMASEDESDVEEYLSSRPSKVRRKTKVIGITIISLLVLAIVAGIIVYFLNRKVERHPQEIQLEIQGGVVRGQYDEDAVVFKGIPYAEPPVGTRRWQASVPCNVNKCWNGTLDATKFRSICVQQDVASPNDPSKVIGSEDCLFVNVWTPRERSPEQPLPVLVYIHVGYLLYFSGNWKGLHPSPEMVSNMNIVGVSFNYRLNAFGFLALKSLADVSPSKTSGNYGFMDQILALKWVQANIRKFGGDPESVTLIGQSSGGTSEVALLASPGASGLFHRAILMSASAVFNKSWEDAAIDNEIFVNNSKCDRSSATAERKCLYKLSPTQIENAIPWDVYPFWRMTDLMGLPTKNRFDGAVAVVDRTVVSDPPLVVMATGKANDVPLIIGTTAQEIDVQPVVSFTNSSYGKYRKHVEEKLRPFLGNDVSKVLDMYNVSLAMGESVQFAFSSMASDLRETCPNNVLALNASKGFHSSVYRYVVTNRPSETINLFGFPSSFAFHMWDEVAFFGFPVELNYKPSKKDKEFMMDLRRELGEFIHKGAVKEESWREYPESTALFTDNGVSVPKEEYHKKECDFWLEQGFFSYGWIN